MHLRDRVVWITGASRGIGAAAALAFARAGARLLLTARSAATLAELQRQLPGGPHRLAPADVRDADALQTLVAQAEAEFGPISVLLNNAGIGLSAAVAQLNPALLRQVLEVNLFGCLHATQAVLPGMRARRQGRIIMVSSVLAAQALPYAGGYAASKAALERLSEALRIELRGSGVRVTLLRPSSTETTFFAHQLGAAQSRRRISTPGVAPELVARALLRAAISAPRLAYVRAGDRLPLLLANCFPALSDALLGWAFRPPET